VFELRVHRRSTPALTVVEAEGETLPQDDLAAGPE